jgi:hypothetical protein
MALYMKEIFSPEGVGVPARAPTAGGESGGVPLEVRVRDDSEELNFDRRAPLSLRFEAASAEDEGLASSYPAPIPTEDAPGAVLAGQAGPLVAGRAASVAGVPMLASASADKKKNGVAAPRVDAPAPQPAATVGVAEARASLNGVAPPAGSRRGWLFLLFLLLGAAALAFVGTR